MTPSHSACPSDGMLRAFARGELLDDQFTSLVAHLFVRRCPRCNERLLTFPDVGESVVSQVSVAHTVAHEPATASALRGADDPLPAGRELRLGRYAIRGRIGRGGFAVVYLAYDEELDRHVAVKVPFAHRLRPDDQGRLTQEARRHAALDHPHIVPLYDVGGTATIPIFFVSKLIVGRNLADRLAEARCAPGDAAVLVARVAGALGHVHERGLVHRDVKPRNILLDEAGTPYLADFGLAVEVRASGDGIAEFDQVAGTLPYMSPEQARGQSERVDRRSDLYSLGVVFYELLTGRRAFAGDPATLHQQILHGDPPAPRTVDPAVPRELEAICLRLMTKDPARRYQTAAEAAADLDRYLARPPGRTRLLVGLAGVAVVALLLLVLVVLFPSKPPVGKPIETVAVRIDTDPPGADVTFVPLDPLRGTPQPERMVRGKANEPVDLAPGPYLVVAVLEERFQEVYRTVPDAETFLPYPFRHQDWTRVEGVVVLPAVRLPPATVADGMCRLCGDPAFAVGSKEFDLPGPLQLAPPQIRRIPEFYLDTTEVTFAAFRARLGKDVQPKFATGPAEAPVTGVTWDQAVGYAEAVGKRLPDEFEYEFAATAGGRSRFPWGDDAKPLEGNPWLIGPVRTPEHDQLRIDGQPAVYGLYSNVAEWTSSWIGNVAGRNPGGPQPMIRMVRGGPRAVVEGHETLREPVPGPRLGLGYATPLEYRGLGFRCARSARPRVRAEDYIRVVEP